MMGFTHPTCLIGLAAFVGEARRRGEGIRYVCFQRMMMGFTHPT